MSADNWATCPRCQQAANDAEAARLRALDAAYGMVPVEEFDALRAVPPVNEIDCTFREDYEIWGADEGVLHVRYSGECQSCRLKHTFDHEDVFYRAPEGGE